MVRNIKLREGVKPQVLHDLIEALSSDLGDGPPVIFHTKGGSFIGGRALGFTEDGQVQVGHDSIVDLGDITTIEVG